MTEIRAYQKTLPKERRYKIGDLLARIDLKRSSYYDECERMKNPYDKYVNVKKLIMEIAQSYVSAIAIPLAIGAFRRNWISVTLI